MKIHYLKTFLVDINKLILYIIFSKSGYESTKELFI